MSPVTFCSRFAARCRFVLVFAPHLNTTRKRAAVLFANTVWQPRALSRLLLGVVSLSLFLLSFLFILFFPSAAEDNPRTVPAIDLTVRNNGVHVHTCVDSCAALARLLKYLSRDGDLNGPTEHVIARDVVDTQSEVSARLRKHSTLKCFLFICVAGINLWQTTAYDLNENC